MGPQTAGTLRVIQSVDPALPVGLQVPVPTTGGVVGRSTEAEICLPGSTVSRQHARLVREGTTWSLEPLTRTNSVFVDGAAVAGATPVPTGASFQLGGVVCVLVEDAGTTPVLQRLDEPVLIEVHDDAGGCTAHAGGALLPLAPLEARLLGELVEAAGRPVHRWDLLEALGASTNLDKAVSKLRAGLRTALEDGVLSLEAVARAVGASADDPEVLVRELIVTRRGHGYLLALPPHQVRRVRV
ncbi:MAG: FHA domain-containing protein [Myxococcales bacterium]|nr:FHA domain-containing protein [Myxococcales bacterium]MCB9669431.1 FHA domain-containing protein [Alphaproteobacteria bacterium]MCB9692186.1 FHA domain-containing protein [Alphaproteobacteria bacterium]